MKRLIIVLFLFGVIQLPAHYCSGAQPEPYKIGILSMLTGPMASTQYGDLARLAAKEINDEGGIKGHMIEIVEEDDAGSPEKAVLAFTKLADREKVIAVLGPVFTHVAAALQPIVNDKKVARIGFNFGTVLDKRAGRYNYRYMASDNMGSEVLIKYLLTQMSGKELKIGIIHDKTPVGMSAKGTFVKALKGQRLTPVGVEAFAMSTISFVPYLKHLQAAGSNVLYLGTTTGPVMGIMRDLGVTSWRPIVIGGLGFGNILGYRRSGGLWDGVRYWSFTDFSRPDTIAFKKKVKAKLNQVFEGESTNQYYDGVKLVGEVLKVSGGDREKFVDTLENLTWKKGLYGPEGTVIRFTPTDHSPVPLEAHVVNQWNPGGLVTTIWRAR